MARFPLSSLPLFLALLVLPSAAHAQDDSLDDLLGSIPDIENPDAGAPTEAEPVTDDVPFATYVDQVRGQVLAVWKPKSGSIKKDPSIETRLVLNISESGEIVALKPMVLSGDKKFDKRAVDAVNAAGILPAPAKNLRSLAAEGVVVIFSGRAWLSRH